MAEKSNKNRKYGRNAKSNGNTAYKAEGRRDKNKKRKLVRHLKRLPNDKQAAKALDNVGRM